MGFLGKEQRGKADEIASSKTRGRETHLRGVNPTYRISVASYSE